MITMAYIGNGKATNRYHLPFSRQVKDIRVKTIYARHDDSPWAKLPDVKYTTNINDIWDDPEIQLVAITTPPQAHFELAKAALDHGKNVLLESHSRRPRPRRANCSSTPRKRACCWKATRTGASTRIFSPFKK